MYEIVVISGKGGTGKTTVCSAFAHLMDNGIICDLDVDAPDMHIICGPQVHEKYDFISGQEAAINEDFCLSCGVCMAHCKFDAINLKGGAYTVDPLRCEGCGVCEAMCPMSSGGGQASAISTPQASAISMPQSAAISTPQAQAISTSQASAICMHNKHCGDWYESESRFGPMIHAQLFPGEENSGRLVSLLKLKAKERAKASGLDFILCDGSPGIGCPVISSLAGARLAVAVVEPTPSGRHDFTRVADLCDHFRIPVNVVINKATLNEAECASIREFCASRGYDIVAEIPFCHDVYEAMMQRKALTELQSEAADLVRSAWGKIMAKAESAKADDAAKKARPISLKSL
ncbi:MAG: ATP-binding protein [Pseudomonadota bacterium]